MTITVNDLVAREVHYCVSSLVSTLARGGEECADKDLNVLCEQAFELASPLSDWEEAAVEAGWSRNVARMTGAPSYRHRDGKEVYLYDGWQDLCEVNDIDPYDREVFEHWIVSDWLADRLAEKGEKVDKDFAGMTVWARTTTGQAISIDSVIEQIHAELVAS